MEKETFYRRWGVRFAVGTFFLTFAISYLYCINEYGFLLGFGLGWIPSFMLAALMAIISAYIWPVYILGFAALLFAVLV